MFEEEYANLKREFKEINRQLEDMKMTLEIDDELSEAERENMQM